LIEVIPTLQKNHAQQVGAHAEAFLDFRHSEIEQSSFQIGMQHQQGISHFPGLAPCTNLQIFVENDVPNMLLHQ
jgi:hypothetical protein